MRCHAKFGPFRCDLDMSDHLPDRHTFTVEWDDEGSPLDRTQDEVDLLGYLEPTPPAPRREPVQTLDPGETEATEGTDSHGRRWWLNPQTGGIVWEDQPGERCSICNHAWHTAPCTVPIQPGEYATPCGCMTAA